MHKDNPSFNKVILVGVLFSDPVLDYSGDGYTGQARCEFTITVGRRYIDGQGQAHDEQALFTVYANGKQAEVLAKYVCKGSPILVDGRLDNDGHGCTMVKLEGFQFIGRDHGLGKKGE